MQVFHMKYIKGACDSDMKFDSPIDTWEWDLTDFTCQLGAFWDAYKNWMG